jgi:RHS repeat-associated protein
MNYGANGKPHALTSISGIPYDISSYDLNVTYTDFKKIKTLVEVFPAHPRIGNKYYELGYGVDDQRRKSVYKVNNVTQLTRYYLGDYEEEINATTGNIRKIHYLSGAIYIDNSNYNDSLYYVYTDYQGSVIALTDEGGTVKRRYAYDPWGKRRNPADWTLADNGVNLIINRGYTGHEHLDAFGIINMNGRVYDPYTATFFSPDPYVQAPGDWLNYNRYSYCINNPLKYTDQSGYWFGIDDLIAAGIGLVAGYITYGIATGNWGWKALGAGATTALGTWLIYNTAGAMGGLLAAAYSTPASGA